MNSLASFDVVPRWYLLFTKPSCERVASANLERQGYRVYLPLVEQRRFNRGSWRQTISALFPRYVFVQLNSALQSFAPLRSTVGIASVVQFGSKYVLVPEHVVKSLIDREDERGLHRLAAGIDLEKGDAIRVTNGPLEGVAGIFERKNGADRVTILLSLLGREARISLPIASVAPAA